jgi:sec-independent protein translocase protein TatB
MLRQLRAMARNATADIKAELGPEMADLDLASLHPRRMLTDAFWDDEKPAVPPTKTYAPLAQGETPPYDPDAT